MREVTLPSAFDLEAARDVVRAHLAPTPLLDGWLKAESLQPTGSFKVRGALAALSRLPAREPVVTVSAGNHGLGVAWAARRLDREATIVVPETASPAKLEALERLGSRVICRGASYDEAEGFALALGGTFLSPYNDTHVIAGQATIGPELPDGPLQLVVPVGGGGLLSGLALWARERGDVHLVGVEAEASPAVSTAVRAGRTVEIDVRPTLADGLAGNLEPGSVTVQGAALADVLLTVSEDEIRAAMRHLASRHGLVVEGSGAVAVAAVLAGRADGIAIVTGRNIALDAYAEVLGPF